MAAVLKGTDVCVTMKNVLFSRSTQACVEIPEKNAK